VEFVFVSLAGLFALALILLAIGKWSPRTGAEVLDWKPTRSYEDEIRLELEDIDQMIEAQNERRRRSGRPEVSADEFRAGFDADRRAQEEFAAKVRAEREQSESGER
jgi:hypothetical protein